MMHRHQPGFFETGKLLLAALIPLLSKHATPDKDTKVIHPKSDRTTPNFKWALTFVSATPASTRFHDEPPEQSSLRAVISSSPAELARYDAEIGRLQGRLQKMQTARAALQFYYDGRRSVFSALHRLPSEILCAIFASVPPDSDLETDKEAGGRRSSDVLRRCIYCVLQ
ncbi:hypothetical protein C8J57DRAFT_1505670 [Mycena rebaudengoi]|nr:hypothetical protein C8J57DRAFT_1505670 [Mycena rebaudengoi]